MRIKNTLPRSQLGFRLLTKKKKKYATEICIRFVLNLCCYNIAI